jgi:hypothetical protein
MHKRSLCGTARSEIVRREREMLGDEIGGQEWVLKEGGGK